ncbi:MAG: hypothetical protein L0170_18410 [Acidobacteria bacterium]|nr:hypothetical protein [Acidobacteriota bacterium]
MTYGLLARLLFTAMDLLYGRKRTLSKFKVLEVIARVPYQSWEHLAFIAITQTHAFPDFARRVVDRVKESRHQQDNAQCKRRAARVVAKRPRQGASWL